MKKLSIIIIVLVAILVCCKKTPEINIKYVDVEREFMTIGQTTATFQCDYQYITTLKSAKLYYGIGEATNYVEMRVVQSTLYAEISCLNGGTTYQYYYEFTNGFNSMHSGVKTFVTESVPVSLPTVITTDITEITYDSATGGGEVTNDGGSTVTARGICWSTYTNPTIEDSHTTDGTGVGAFTSNLTNLNPNTTYHVRAYAINEAGTAYGFDKEFITGDGGSGILNGLFTINSNYDKIRFSKGNLQYQASTNTWRFALHQWNYIGTQTPDENGDYGGNVNGSDNHMISSSYDGWIDLFGWATSGYNHGAIAYYPYSTSNVSSDYYAYGNLTSNLNDQSGMADWGYNVISNGSNTENIWRTLTHEEWVYLLDTRFTESGIRYAQAKVNEVNGVILLPDNWDSAIYNLNSTNQSGYYNSNTIDLYEWENILETNGAVFIPAGGDRSGNKVGGASTRGMYWSATYKNSTEMNKDWAYVILFQNNQFVSVTSRVRHAGISVRLVQDAE